MLAVVEPTKKRTPGLQPNYSQTSQTVQKKCSGLSILRVRQQKGVMTNQGPHPFVYWAQTRNNVSLRVDLKDVKDPKILVKDDAVELEAVGTGALGTQPYQFSVTLYSTIDPKQSKYRVTDRQIDINLKKVASTDWPRLTSTKDHFPWIKFDFDKWGDVEDDDEDSKATNSKHNDKLRPNLRKKNLLDEFSSENIASTQAKFKKIYLTVYNLWQFLAFSYIMSTLVSKYLKDGSESFPEIYSAVGHALKFSQLMQFLEILHPLFGYTKGGLGEAIVQVGGRAIILFGVINPEDRIQTKPVIFYLFFVWTLVELVRYPYYALRVHNAEIGFITWLRYTIWIPLYPLGFLCEGIVILRSIPYYEETGILSVKLPNRWNFAFDFPTLMRIYLLFFFLPAMYVMMSRMQKQRRHKLEVKRKAY